MNLFHLESRSSAVREHLPMVLFKLAVRKEVGNDRLLAALQFVELAPKKDLFIYLTTNVKNSFGELCVVNICFTLPSSSKFL